MKETEDEKLRRIEESYGNEQKRKAAESANKAPGLKALLAEVKKTPKSNGKR